MITEIDDWSKMKGSRGKNKMGKLETHFSSATHSSERERIVELENKRVQNREVIEILFDVLVLTRNGFALRGQIIG